MTESKYRRFHRFFKEVYFYYDAIVRLIMEMFDFYQLQYYLTLDRTNCKQDQYLDLYKGVEVPTYWLILNKQGNSNQKERQRFIHQFGCENILGILEGREFIGEQWWKW